MTCKNFADHSSSYLFICLFIFFGGGGGGEVGKKISILISISLLGTCALSIKNMVPSFPSSAFNGR